MVAMQEKNFEILTSRMALKQSPRRIPDRVNLPKKYLNILRYLQSF